MEHLDEDQVEPGRIVRLDEGYAKLIQSDGDTESYMEDTEGPVFVKQRWLIEWADISELGDISTEEYWNQRYLTGKRTHRYVHWYGAVSWEQYAYQHGPLKSAKYYNRGSERPSDDSNLIF